MFYQSELPGTLRFEVIVNPGDFRENLISLTEGFHYGPDAFVLEESRYNPGFSFDPGKGYSNYLVEKWHSDAPGWNRRNWELGLKVSGYTWDWDWSLIYYNSIYKTGVADPEALTVWAGNYFGYSAVPGFAGGGPGGDFDYPSYHTDEVFKWKRSDMVGGTLEHVLVSGGPAFRGGILTFEWFYQMGQPMNKTWIGGEGKTGNLGLNSDTGEYGTIVKRDVVGGAVKFYQRINIPGFTNSFIATGKQFEFTLTYFYEKVRNHDRELSLSSGVKHKWKNSHADSISFFAIQQMFNYSWTAIFNSFYKPSIDQWMLAPAVRYTFPGSQFYVEGGYIMYGGPVNQNQTRHDYVNKESIMLKLAYEF
jgi:hypothetical protein